MPGIATGICQTMFGSFGPRVIRQLSRVDESTWQAAARVPVSGSNAVPTGACRVTRALVAVEVPVLSIVAVSVAVSPGKVVYGAGPVTVPVSV